MRLFNHDATRLLCNKLSALKEERENWRCIHLKLSSLPIHQNPRLWSSFFIRGIKEKLGDMDGFVYALEDNDIFIIFEGRAHPIITKLGGYFADIKAVPNAAREGGIYYVYDLGKEWLFLFFLLHRKRNQQDHVFANA